MPLTTVGVVTVVFLALRLIPGDPAVALAGEKASVEQVERVRAMRAKRAAGPWEQGLKAVEDAGRNGTNLMPAIIHAILGRGSITHVWLYVVGPCIGSAIAATIFTIQHAPTPATA